MTVYRTIDGNTYLNEDIAIAHNQMLEYNHNGGLPVTGKPYEYLKIDRCEDGIHWV